MRFLSNVLTLPFAILLIPSCSYNRLHSEACEISNHDGTLNLFLVINEGFSATITKISAGLQRINKERTQPIRELITTPLLSTHYAEKGTKKLRVCHFDYLSYFNINSSCSNFSEEGYYLNETEFLLIHGDNKNDHFGTTKLLGLMSRKYKNLIPRDVINTMHTHNGSEIRTIIEQINQTPRPTEFNASNGCAVRLQQEHHPPHAHYPFENAYNMCLTELTKNISLKAKEFIANKSKTGEFIVIHWRRGDQLHAPSRCPHHQKQPLARVVCGEHENLIKFAAPLAEKFPVYVATNEANETILADIEKVEGIVTARMLPEYESLKKIEHFALDLQLMVWATELHVFTHPMTNVRYLAQHLRRSRSLCENGIKGNMTDTGFIEH
eukprot:m.146510 g.146510  ORF g.146510 m.146510 type:complete len:382 (-) comp14974_c0_seq4:2442-3587(-)